MWCACGQSEGTTSCKGKIPWAKGNYAARWAELFMQMWSGRVWNGNMLTGRGRVSWQPYMQYSSRFSLNLIGAWAAPRQTKTTSFLCNTWNALNSYYVQRISGHNSTEIHKCPDIYGFVNILLWKIRLEPEPKRRFFCAQPAGKKFYRKILVPHFPPLLFCSSFFPSRFSILHLHCDKRIFS